MAHELTINELTGLAEFAYRGTHGMPWHHLGQEMPATASLEDWRERAGMNWSVERSPVQFEAATGPVTIPGKLVLHRSDNSFPLGVVSDSYVPTHPSQMLEFFRGILKEGGLELSAAGTLQGGKRFWATARVADAEPLPGDRMTGFLQILSSADGSLATTVRRTAIRAVCANTIRQSMSDAPALTVLHRTELDLDAVRRFMGFNVTAWDQFQAQIKALANRPVFTDEAEELLVPILRTREQASDDEVRNSYGFRTVMDLFSGAGKGARIEGVMGTRWGLLNGVTEFIDHHTRATSAASRLNSSQFGPGAAIKSRALELLSA